MCRAPLLLCVLAGGVPAQAVLRVGPTQPFADIQSAVTAGQPGDIVLIDPGSYPGFTLAREMTLRTAQAAGTVTVSSPVALTLTGTANAVLDGLTCTGLVSATGPAGVITCSACTFNGGFGATDAYVDLVGCTLRQPLAGSALTAGGISRVAAVQSSFQGGITSFWPTNGIFIAQQTTLQLSHCTVTAGAGWGHQITPGTGLSLAHSATAWLSDSTVSAFASASASSGAYAIVNSSSQPVIVDRCTLNASNIWVPATTGPVLNGFLLGVSSPSQLALGAAFQLDFDTRPGLPVVVHGSLRIGPPVTMPVLAQPEWGFAGNSIVMAVLIGNSNGAASLTVPVPNVPAFAHVGVWFQAWSELNLPVQLCPPLGGVIR